MENPSEYNEYQMQNEKKKQKKISLPNIPTYIMNSPNQLDAPVEI